MRERKRDRQTDRQTDTYANRDIFTRDSVLQCNCLVFVTGEQTYRQTDTDSGKGVVIVFIAVEVCGEIK